MGIGPIPWQHFHDLVQNQALRQICLGNNKFTDVGAIPPIVCEMTKLEVLTLHSLGFAGGYLLVVFLRTKTVSSPKL